MNLDLSLRQALDVWSDLEAALYGKNRYGSDEAEIYAFRLQHRDSTAEATSKGFAETKMCKEAAVEQAKQAANNLLTLLAEFKRVHGCRILLDVRRSELRRYGLHHRCHVKIIPNPKSRAAEGRK